MKAAGFSLVAGLALVAGLVVWQGVDDVAALLALAGGSLLLVGAFHLLPFLATTLAWRSLLRAQGVEQPWWRLFAWRWLGDSINALLPVAQVGGEVVRGRLLAGSGVGAAAVGAGIIVDLTMGLVSLVVFILGGMALLLAGGGGRESLFQLGFGVGVFALMLWAFWAVQRSGALMRLAHLLERHEAAGRAWVALGGGAAALDRELAALYARRGAVLGCLLWRLAAWVLGALEVWLALWVLGHPVGVLEALILESLGQAFRNAGFAIPGALGVQEGGLMMVGGLIGLPPEVALALGLVKRVRDLTLGVPALLLWLGLRAVRARDADLKGAELSPLRPE